MLQIQDYNVWLQNSKEPNYYSSCVVQFRIVAITEHSHYKIGCRWSVFGQWEETHGTKVDDETWSIIIPVFRDEVIASSELDSIEVAFFLQYGNRYEEITVPWAINDIDITTIWYNNDGTNFVYSLHDHCDEDYDGSCDSTYELSYVRDPYCTVKLCSMERTDDVCTLAFSVTDKSCTVIEVGIRYAPLGDWSKGKVALVTVVDGSYQLRFDHLEPIEFAVFAKYVGRYGIELAWDNNGGDNYRV